MLYFLIFSGLFLALITAVLFSKLKGRIAYENQRFSAFVIFWFLKIQVYPRKKKIEKEKKRKIKKAKTVNKTETKEENKKDIKTENIEAEKDKKETDYLDLIRKHIEIVSSIRGKLTILNLSIKMEIGTGDAAETAILCGGLYAGIYTLLGSAQNIFFINRPEIVINPDYNGKTAKVEYMGEVSASVLTYILIAVKAIKIYLKD